MSPEEAGDTAAPKGVPEPSGPIWDRLNDQMAWYDRKASEAQQLFKRTKALELVAAALVPVFAPRPEGAPWLVALLGALVIVLEGLQHLNQWQQNWTLYRSTAEALKRERYLFLARAGSYREADRTQVLAENVEKLLAQEHSGWAELRKPEAQKGDGAK